jgi:hypothetical protein
MGNRAHRLFEGICEALEQNQRIQSDRRLSLEGQAAQAASYVGASLRKLARIRKHKLVLSSKRQDEVGLLENRLLTEVERSLDILEDALVSVTIVDIVRGDARIDRVLSDLGESNARLRDLADAHQDVKNVGRLQTWEDDNLSRADN